MASAKAVGGGAISISHFKMPAHLTPGVIGEPRDMGVSRLDPWPEPGAQEIPTSMGEPGGRPSSNQLSRFVIGKATPLARPPTPESPDPSEVGKWMGGMVVVSSPYAGGVQGPGVGEVFPDARGLNTLSKPSSLLSLSPHLVSSVCSIQLWNIWVRSLAARLGNPVLVPGIVGRGCHNSCYFGLVLLFLACQLAL